MSYQSIVLADTPLRWYKLNETSGTAALDYGSQGTNGTLHGGITLNQAKLAPGLDACMLLDGASGYIDVPTTGLPTGAFAWTIETWLEVASTPSSRQEVVAFSFGTGFYFQSDGTIRAWDGAHEYNGGTLSNNAAHHLVLTYDGSSVSHFYLDGSSVGSNASGSIAVFYDSFHIGANDGLSRFFAGSESETAFYTAALSSARVTAYYTAGITAPHLLSCMGNHRSFGRVR